MLSETCGLHFFSDVRGKRLVGLSKDRLSAILIATPCRNAARESVVPAEAKRGTPLLQKTSGATIK
jgi:hypothetical protein